MARERIIVKEAINALKYLLTQLMKKNNDDFTGSIDELVLNSNLFAFAVRFLRDIGKISDVVNELISRLNILGNHLIKSISANELRHRHPESSLDEIYSKIYELKIYPLARILEAFGGSNTVLVNSNASKSLLVSNIVEILLSYFENDDELFCLFDTNQKFVPIVQGMLSVIDGVSEKKLRECITGMLSRIKDIALENDPEINKISTQDIFYSIKLKTRGVLSEDEKKPLMMNLKSKVFKRVLKGIEYLTMFGIEPPQNAVDYVLSIMPRFFSEIFRVGNSHNTFIYFSSIAESMLNILNYYNNKAFAQAMMNYLIEDTGWIARNNYSYVDFVKTVIGTSLLIQARGAIRR